MLDNRYDLSPILVNYPADCQIASSGTEALPPGGFSGARIWRLPAKRGLLCLRRSPAEYQDQSHLRWTHDILAGAYRAGFHLIPVPFKTATGQTFVNHANFLWQLEPWLPGEADDGPPPFQPASTAHIIAALSALANFHQAVIVQPTCQQPAGPPPGILKRSTELHALQSGGIDRLTNVIAANSHVWPELAARAPALLNLFPLIAPQTGELLRQAAQWIVPIRPCIRDIHRQHVLFTSDQVTGIVDFGAMQSDHVAADITRLLGSLAGQDPQMWQAGLQAYLCVLPLSEQDLRLVQIYNTSGLLLGGIHWLQWVFVGGRVFVNRDGVLARFDEILRRLIELMNRRDAPASIKIG